MGGGETLALGSVGLPGDQQHHPSQLIPSVRSCVAVGQTEKGPALPHACPLAGVPRTVKSIEAESGIELTMGWGRGTGELVFKEQGVHAEEDEKLGTVSGDGHPAP